MSCLGGFDTAKTTALDTTSAGRHAGSSVNDHMGCVFPERGVTRKELTVIHSLEMCVQKPEIANS